MQLACCVDSKHYCMYPCKGCKVGNSVLVCAEHQLPRAGAILTLCLCKEGGKGESHAGVARGVADKGEDGDMT